MTVTPTTPTRGGKRAGAGRPKKPGVKHLIEIRCETEEDFCVIRDYTLAEQRGKELLLLAKTSKLLKEVREFEKGGE
mgnify:CR=1 FL=1